MARYPVVNTGTMDVTLPKTTEVLSAIKALQDAEQKFYEARKDLLNSYPGKIKDFTTIEVESLYDRKIGVEPWNYFKRYESSGSTLKSGSYPTPSVGGSNPLFEELADSTETCFWINMNWPGSPQSTPSEGYPYVWIETTTDPETGMNVYTPKMWRYLPTRGANWIDLMAAESGYNNLFTKREPHQTYTQSGFSWGSVDRNTDYYSGFGNVPIAYDGKGGLSDWEAHMNRLVGLAWNDSVGPTLGTYKEKLKEYQDSSKSAASFVFDSASTKGLWEGYKQTESNGVNRPGKLSVKLVKELRGI